MQHIDDPLLILSQLINNSIYFDKVIHHIDEAYFDFALDKRIFKFICKYNEKYSSAPTPLIVKNVLSKLELSDNEHIQYINEFIELIEKGEIVPIDPMLDKTEEFVKSMEMKNAVLTTVAIYSGESKEFTPEQIPDIFKGALSKTIDDDLGECYFSEESARKRMDLYTNKEYQLPFDIDICDEVTDGGISGEALHCLVAGPNVGKSSTLIGLSANYLESGKDVLYCSLEMSYKQVGLRFDARLLNRETSEIPKINVDNYVEKVLEKKEKGKTGQLYIKNWASNELTALKLDAYLTEFYMKVGKYPDVIVIDYMGICSSAYLKDRSNIGMYYTKVAEEFRAISQKTKVPIWTAQQMTTDSLSSTDPEIKDIGYGQGIAKTSDLVWFLIRTEELDKVGQIMVKQVKTRYHKIRIQRFCLGFDIGRMKIYGVDNQATTSISSVIQNQEPIKPEKKIASAFNGLGKSKGKMTV